MPATSLGVPLSSFDGFSRQSARKKISRARIIPQRVRSERIDFDSVPDSQPLLLRSTGQLSVCLREVSQHAFLQTRERGRLDCILVIASDCLAVESLKHPSTPTVASTGSRPTGNSPSKQAYNYHVPTTSKGRTR